MPRKPKPKPRFGACWWPAFNKWQLFIRGDDRPTYHDTVDEVLREHEQRARLYNMPAGSAQ